MTDAKFFWDDPLVRLVIAYEERQAALAAAARKSRDVEQARPRKGRQSGPATQGNATPTPPIGSEHPMTKIVERHRTTIGLLNVDVTDLANMSAGYQAMTDRRLEEIERRILALDAALNLTRDGER